VSVVIAAFNMGRYLPETLESVFAQSYANYEVIVVNDGSTDDTVSQAAKHRSRVSLIERPHEGLGPARNAGLARSRGDFVAFLDADDLWDPDALRTQVEVARQNPESGLIACDGVEFEGDAVTNRRLCPLSIAVRVDATSKACLTEWMYRDVLEGCPISCPAQALIPRRTIDRIGPVCLTPNGAQDFDYYLRIARNFPITFHASPLVRWRFRPESMSGLRETRGLRWAAHALCVYERELASCAPADRAAVHDVITRRGRAGIAEAAHTQLEAGIAPDPEHLATIYRFLPRDPVVVWARTVFALPAPIDRAALLGTRAASRAVRRVRNIVRT
jgi:glycosyltransferase involved in cell wall biosynthesis